MPNADPELTRRCLELMRTAETVYLTTLDADGFPCTRAMMNLRCESWYPELAPLFAAHDGDFLVYLVTFTSSEKVRQLLANPKASLYYCSPAAFQGLMLAGSVEVVADPEIRRAVWQPDWSSNYPAGVEDGEYCLIRMLPRKARGWNGFRAFEFGFSAP